MGTSVFVLGDRPELGGNNMARAVKLSPLEYPTWNVAVDLPESVTVNYRFVTRQDDAASLSNPANGTVIVPTPTPVLVPGPAPALGDLVIETDAVGTTSATVQISTRTGTANIPGDLSDTRFRVRLAGSTLDTDARFRCLINRGGIITTYPAAGLDAWHARPGYRYLRNGELFAYDPGTASLTGPTFQVIDVGPPSPNPANLLGRKVRVYLPRGYAQNTGRRYPVIYWHDGQNMYDDSTAAFGTAWEADDAATSLIRRADIPEVIMVAIDNTANRFAEYIPDTWSTAGVPGTFTPVGREYLQYVLGTIKPLIDSTYRTLPDRSHTSMGGSSLGALITYYASFEFEESFVSCAAVSCSFQVDLAKNLALAGQIPMTTTRLWVDCGTSNDGFTNSITIRDALVDQGYSLGSDYTHYVAFGASHNEASWEQRVGKVIEFLQPQPDEIAPVAPAPTGMVLR